jgi:hypothetical protein
LGRLIFSVDTIAHEPEGSLNHGPLQTVIARRRNGAAMTIELSNEDLLQLVRALEHQIASKGELTRLDAARAQSLLDKLRSHTDTPPRGVARLAPPA